VEKTSLHLCLKKDRTFQIARQPSQKARYLKCSVFFFEHAVIQENAIRELRAITESAFQEAFQRWKKRWERCIASRGDYFEGDSA
jgi:hypothetical protein